MFDSLGELDYIYDSTMVYEDTVLNEDGTLRFDDTKLNDLFADVQQNFKCEIIDGDDYKDIRPNSFQIDKHISGTNEREVKDNQKHLKESYTRLILKRVPLRLSLFW